MMMLRNIIWTALICQVVIADDTITIYNQTPRDLNVAIYYSWPKMPFVAQADAQLATDIYPISAKSSAPMQRPPHKFGADRQLVFVEDATLLTATVTPENMSDYHSKNVGSLKGSTFYIADDQGDLYGYTSLEWDTIHAVLEAAEQELLDLLPAFSENPYSATVATVRTSNDLCDQEVAYLANRLPVVTRAMQQLGAQTDDVRMPVIAVACSGGGYRAMLYTVGALVALQNTQLLNAVTYLVGLSGSTWAIATWLSSGKPIQDFHDWLMNNLGGEFPDFDKDDGELIGQVIATKYLAGQPIGFVDLYGACVANELFDFFTTTHQDLVYLSAQSAAIADGSLPFPIYTCVAAEDNADQRLWYEFSPYEVGAQWMDAYVPTWSFGRKFIDGSSRTYSPEQPLSTLLGTFGLAIGASLKDIFMQEDLGSYMDSALLKNLVRRIMAKYGNDRLISAEYLNFVMQLPNTPFNDTPVLELVDAGLDFNLPYPPISGQRPARKADIIIFLDASAGTVGQQLHAAEEYAHFNNLPFPEIDYTNIDQHAVSVFADDTDINVPVVIYIPRVIDQALLDANQNNPEIAPLYNLLSNFDINQCINSGPCDTFNFSYTPAQAEQMMALGECNMYLAQDAIAQAIDLKIGMQNVS